MLRHIQPQPGLPIATEIQRPGLVQVPALADHQKVVHLFRNLLCGAHQIGHEEHVRIGKTEQGTIAMCMTGLQDRANQRDAFFITAHIRYIPEAKLACQPGNARLITNQNNFHILQVHPGLDSIPLDGVDVRISKWLGSSEDRQQRHGYFRSISNLLATCFSIQEYVV